MRKKGEITLAFGLALVIIMGLVFVATEEDLNDKNIPLLLVGEDENSQINENSLVLIDDTYYYNGGQVELIILE